MNQEIEQLAKVIQKHFEALHIEPCLELAKAIKDAGYSKQAQVLSERELTKIATEHLKQDASGHLSVNIETYIKAICAKFSPTPGVKHIEPDRAQYGKDRNG